MKAETIPPLDISDAATDYARAVADGRIVAGPHVRAACARHLRDLETGPARGLTWDIEAADRAIGFFRDVLRLNSGQWEGQPYRLLPWQAFVIGSLFGWLGPDGYRRFRVAYIETAKGSGKSPLAAGVGLYGLVADNEPRAEIYAAATTRDQAMNLYRDAIAMVHQSPPLAARLLISGAPGREWNIAYPIFGSFFRPISTTDRQSGARPHIALLDEIHEHKDAYTVEMQRAGTKSRRQALVMMITNSGTDKHSICWSYHDYAGKVAGGMLDDDAFFGYVCAHDPGEDPLQDESCWLKSNPSLDAGIPGLKYLREQVTQARGMPAKEADVRRWNFCQWVDAANPWIGPDVWLQQGRDIDIAALAGRRAWGGLDLASTTDLTAFLLLVEPAAAGEPWVMLPYCWLPEDGLAQREHEDRVPYTLWKRQGHLLTSPGKAIDRLHIATRIAALCAPFDVREIRYDRWRVKEFQSAAEAAGIVLPPLAEHGQGYKDMSPAIEALETRLLNGTTVHPNHPILTWCAANAVTVRDDSGNRKFSKDKATGRIDLIVAAAMACAAAAHITEPDATPQIVVL